MIFYIPYGTDAPIYHRPIITIAMIVINYIVYAMSAASPFGSIDAEQFASYTLAIGSGLHPLQWLTCNFLHQNFFHFLTNMFFLWAFGLIVEGKIGAYKTLAVYLGIGILYGAVTQIFMLQHEPTFCLGASAAIYGLAAMSLIWAPSNRIDSVLIVFLFPFIRIKNLEPKVGVIVGIFLLLQIVMLVFFIDKLSSELLHLVGAIIGLIVGIVMLKTKLVDCEHWDIFSVWAGENLVSDDERAEVEANKPEAIQRRAEARAKRQNLLIEEITLALENQTPLPALVIFQRTEREFTDWTLPQDLHLTLIKQLLGGKHWEEAATVMRLYLERHQEQRLFVHLMLAQTYLKLNKPKSAMEALDAIPTEKLSPENTQAISKVRIKAEDLFRKNLEEGIY